MNDQNSRHGAGETALSGQSPATTESGKRLIGESAPSWPPKPRESITTRRHSNSQTLVGKAGTQRIKRSPVKTALYMVGVLMMLFSATMLPPMAMAWWYDGYALVVPFAQTMAATLGLGLLCWLPVYPFKIDLRNRDGFILVVAFWVLSSLLGALPFMLSENPHMRLVDAVFETVSGLTTTGATALPGLERVPKSILYYRAQLHFLGGIGIIVLAVWAASRKTGTQQPQPKEN